MPDFVSCYDFGLKSFISMGELSSYLEKIIYEKIYELFDDELIEKIETNEYYPWLINPYTKKNLQLDFLIYFKEKIDFKDSEGKELRKDSMLAIEVQGQQHYHYITEFHKKKNDLKHQKTRDSMKLRQCRELGIPLIVIKYNRITWKMDFKKLILKQMHEFKKDNEYGIKNRDYLIGYISTLSKFNWLITKIDKDQLDRINEMKNFLKE